MLAIINIIDKYSKYLVVLLLSQKKFRLLTLYSNRDSIDLNFINLLILSQMKILFKVKIKIGLNFAFISDSVHQMSNHC